MIELLQILPRLPPALDGIGDYAVHLAQALMEHEGVRTQFLVCDPNWSGPAAIDGFPIARLSLPSADALGHAVAGGSPDRIVLLHYVGYGFQKRGLPFWLISGLSRRHAGAPKIAVMFHEVWASGSPRQSAFYLGWLQRWLVRRLHRTAWRSATSTLRMRDLLTRLHPKPVRILPIPATVATAAGGHPIACRPPYRLVVFGQTAARDRTAKVHENLLREWVSSHRLERVVVVGKGATAGQTAGPDVQFLRRVIPETRLQVRGELSPALISDELRQAHALISFYPASLLCKSTTVMCGFASACPVIISDRENAAPLDANEHFLSCDGTPGQIARLSAQIEGGALERIAGNAWRWYQECVDWPVLVRNFGKWLEGSPNLMAR